MKTLPPREGGKGDDCARGAAEKKSKTLPPREGGKGSELARWGRGEEPGGWRYDEGIAGRRCSRDDDGGTTADRGIIMARRGEKYDTYLKKTR